MVYFCMCGVICRYVEKGKRRTKNKECGGTGGKGRERVGVGKERVGLDGGVN